MKKILLLTLLILTICSVAFAAPDKPEEATLFGTLEYQLMVKNISVFNADENTWYRLNKTPQSFDVVYLNAGATQYWFNTAGLKEGNYTKARVIFGQTVTYRGHVRNGADHYWTSQNPLDAGKMIQGAQPEFSGSERVTYTITNTDIDNTKSLYGAGTSIGRASEFAGTPATYPSGVDPNDIRVNINMPFTLRNGVPQSMIVTWDLTDSITGQNFNGTDCDIVIKLPKVTVTVQ